MPDQEELVSITSLTQITPAIRGLLAERTDDEDRPYYPVILSALTDQAALDFAAGTGRQPPPILGNLDSAPLYLEGQGDFKSITALHQQLTSAFERYLARHGAKPEVICLPGLGVLYLNRNLPKVEGSLPRRVALVTGAAGAIGHGICQELLNQGCYLAVSDLPGERLDSMVAEFAQTTPGRILGVSMDVTDPNSVAQGFAQVIGVWGGVDLVVVNAGIALVSTLVKMDLSAFRKLEQVNIEGTLLTIAEAGRLLTLQGTGGDIILISTKNVFAPGASFGAYSATKAASHQLARIASLELAPFGIRVNMVAPDAIFSDGAYKSGLWAEVGPDRMKARGLDEKGLEEYYRSRNLLKAKVTARHVANAVLFFVTHQTPTTGATIPVDGGLPDATPR